MKSHSGMNFHSLTAKCFRAIFLPVRTNATFLTMMYVLGVVCAWVTVPHVKGAHLYDNLYPELFLDLYLLCVILTLIPSRFRPWMRGGLYVMFYLTALADVYCFTKFGSTLTPSLLLLLSETDGREAAEFVKEYFTPDVIFSRVGWILLLLMCHAVVSFRRFIGKDILQSAPCRWIGLRKRAGSDCRGIRPWGGMIVLTLLIWGVVGSAQNKMLTARLMSGKTIGEVEHLLTAPKRADLYHPVYRLAFGIYANSLAARQVKTLLEASGHVKVDSCSFISPHIVLIIGESYGRHHSQQYGYFMPTTPRQLKREKKGFLVKYTDVVTPWNLTSFVFKHLFSMHDIGDRGEWSDYPLFPQLFRKAGYHVTFITNQFLPKAKEEVYDFSGGFFLNNPGLSKSMFDTRNGKLHPFDEGLLEEYDTLKSQNKKYNLTIFHLIGQHVSYKKRYPKDRKKFRASDYDFFRADLTTKQKQMLANYDNAVLYNDSVTDQIIRRFEKEEAIVIYVPDHGEECYEEDRGFICRNHSSEIDYKLARYEFEIPFWIWCSRQYAARHPEIYKAVIRSRHRRLMTDVLPHMLLYLAGIHTEDYRDRRNILSPEYDENRPRLLKGKTDYDKLYSAPKAKGDIGKNCIGKLKYRLYL